MAGSQFIHLECYSLQTPKCPKAGSHSVKSVMAEAIREAGSCPHVLDPQPPVLLFGVDPREIEALTKIWVISSVDAIGRKLRKDGLCLLAGVISCPPSFNAK